jgi:ATP-dependent DNA helicase RecG
MPPGTLFPTEVPQYDAWVIREALHNAIAHQDYAVGGRVNVIEKPDELIFSNVGRFLPLPDYVTEPDQQRVEVRITGRILGVQYTHALMQQPDLSLMDVFLLDKVQKRLPISADVARALRTAKLIEGRTPNIHVSAKVAQVMGEQAQQTLNKGLDSAYYRELVLQHLRNFTACKREELEAVMR